MTAVATDGRTDERLRAANGHDGLLSHENLITRLNGKRKERPVPPNRKKLDLHPAPSAAAADAAPPHRDRNVRLPACLVYNYLAEGCTVVNVIIAAIVDVLRDHPFLCPGTLIRRPSPSSSYTPSDNMIRRNSLLLLVDSLTD